MVYRYRLDLRNIYVKIKNLPCTIRPPPAQKRRRRRDTALCCRRRGPAAQRPNGTAAARTSAHARIPDATPSSNRRFSGVRRRQERTASTRHKGDFSRRRRNHPGSSWVRILYKNYNSALNGLDIFRFELLGLCQMPNVYGTRYLRYVRCLNSADFFIQATGISIQY
jgi:hypothetical protein